MHPNMKSRLTFPNPAVRRLPGGTSLATGFVNSGNCNLGMDHARIKHILDAAVRYRVEHGIFTFEISRPTRSDGVLLTHAQSSISLMTSILRTHVPPESEAFRDTG